MRALSTIILLIASNVFMTFAWYGHLKFKEMTWSKNLGLLSIVIISWLIALFKYALIIPANKYGFKENGGPFNLFQLKIIQEAITLIIFSLFTIVFVKTENFKWNHAAALL